MHPEQLRNLRRNLIRRCGHNMRCRRPRRHRRSSRCLPDTRYLIRRIDHRTGQNRQKRHPSLRNSSVDNDDPNEPPAPTLTNSNQKHIRLINNPFATVAPINPQVADFPEPKTTRHLASSPHLTPRSPSVSSHLSTQTRGCPPLPHPSRPNHPGFVPSRLRGPRLAASRHAR